MNKQEILKLHELSYKNATSELNQHRVLHGGESLADCAFRLRDEVGDGMAIDDLNKQFDIFKMCCKGAKNPQIPINDLFTTWWTLHSKPIHWIQAALLAQGEQDDT